VTALVTSAAPHVLPAYHNAVITVTPWTIHHSTSTCFNSSLDSKEPELYSVENIIPGFTTVVKRLQRWFQ
jgi:hypothetical protein